MFACRSFYLLLSFSNLYFIEGQWRLHNYIPIRYLPLRTVDTSRKHKASTRTVSVGHSTDSGIQETRTFQTAG